jgi:recombination protein RecA
VAKKTKPKTIDPADEAIKMLNKQYGDGTLQRGRGAFVDVDSIPTGVPNLDVALGCGGIPRGRMTEVYGNESSGTTTLCLNIIASCQMHGGVAAFIDAEHALDLDWAKENGVDLDNLIISQPNSGQEALNVVETLVQSGGVDLIVIDSVAALVPQEELDGEVGDTHIGAQARMLSQACRKLAGKLKRSNCAVLFVNQLREKVGVTFGNPELTPGGRALKFYSSVRMDVRRKSGLTVKNMPYGMLARVKVAKNKVAPPFLSAEFEIHFGQPFQEPRPRKGIFTEAALVSAAMSIGVLRTGGSFYYPTELAPGMDPKKSLANGRDNLIEALGEDTGLCDKIQSAVYDTIRGRVKSKDTDKDDLSED